MRIYILHTFSPFLSLSFSHTHYIYLYISLSIYRSFTVFIFPSISVVEEEWETVGKHNKISAKAQVRPIFFLVSPSPILCLHFTPVPPISNPHNPCLFPIKPTAPVTTPSLAPASAPAASKSSATLPIPAPTKAAASSNASVADAVAAALALAAKAGAAAQVHVPAPTGAAAKSEGNKGGKAESGVPVVTGAPPAKAPPAKAKPSANTDAAALIANATAAVLASLKTAPALAQPATSIVAEEPKAKGKKVWYMKEKETKLSTSPFFL